MNSFHTCFSRWVAVLAAFLALVTTSLVNAQICGIPGMIGNAAVSAAVNTYFAGSGTPAAGTSSINLLAGATSRRGVAVNLVAGDLVLIMQMQDNATVGNLVGNYEYAVVTVGGGVGTTIQLASNLVNSYAQTITAATGVVRTFQVIRVPQYSSATLSGTINVLPWFVDPVSGAGTGGVFAVDVAGLLTSNGVTINANARGFRGGLGVNSGSNRAGGGPLDPDYDCNSATLNGSFKGEGTAGIPKRVLGFDTTGVAGTATTYDAATQLYVTAGNRGFLGGSCGRAAQGNSGGGGNDGDPPANTNGLNSGGGGGGNVGVGGVGGNNWNQNDPNSVVYNQSPPAALGTGGWPAGGRGGLALAPALATKIYLGGGGGAGSANNASANVITTFPPSAPGAPPAANGATGALTSSGAPGGGVVIWRAGAVTISAASTINAQGAHAYTKAPNGDTDSAGGGGGGGTVVIDNATGSLTNLTINAFGGIGGSSNYFNHGPGGGGGGGFIFTRGTGATTSVIAGTPGTDGCCGGTAGNASPKNYGATGGTVGAVTTSGVGNPPGSSSGAQCLPNLTVSKVAVTPLITAATGATAQYTVNVRNTGGAATNVFIYDTGLPPGWAYATLPATLYAYSPAPPLAGGAFAAGAEDVLATGVANPPVLPVNNYTAFNTSPLALRGAGVQPRLVPTAGQGSVTFGNFFIPQNGSISVTFAVTIPDAATVGTYHNGAGVSFLDPTRTSNAGRAIAPATNISANRNTLAYSGNTTFVSGGTSTVAGSHYSGLVDGSFITDDVRLLPDFSITKAAPATAVAGTTYNYTITPRNNGRAIAVQVFSATQATDVALANLGTVMGASPLTLTDTLPTGVLATNTFAGTNWVCSGTSPIVCTLPDVNAYPIAATTNFPLVTGTVRVTCLGGSVKTNTVVISPGAGETLLTNNTGTVTTTVTPGCVNATLTVAKFNSVIFPATLVAGQTTSYTITVANLGPGAAGGTTLRDVPSAGLSCTTNPTCTATAGAACPGSLDFNTLLGSVGLVIPTLGSGSSVTFALTCGVTATGLP